MKNQLIHIFNTIKNELNEKGFSIAQDVFSESDLIEIEREIALINSSGDSYLKTKDLFAIRKFFATSPVIKKVILTDKFKSLITEVGGEDYFLVKAIYFDKPKSSNWFVSYHQDLSISVDRKVDVQGYNNWTEKRGQLGVIPPLEVLENIITLRIHLDDTNKDNGALRVIPNSHLRGIIRKEKSDILNEELCEVRRGGVMLMKPLTLHASGRSKGISNRRVIHLEFSNKELKEPLKWLEKSIIFAKE